MFEVELAPVGFTQSILDFRFWILDSDRSTLKAKNQFTMQCFDCENHFGPSRQSAAADRNCFRPSCVSRRQLTLVLPPPIGNALKLAGLPKALFRLVVRLQ
jgi:hypothetical protein